ncbi:MAG: endolytic transglycosylase MltG [Patescibacteria group bacterium]
MNRKIWVFAVLSIVATLAFRVWVLNPELSLAVSDSFSDVSSLFNNLSGSMLASASSRIVYVREGMRKEEVGELFARKLDWNDTQKLAFLRGPEGEYYPGTYSISNSKDENVMRELMLHRFEREVEERLSSSTKSVVSIPTIIKVASIIEREAGGKRDMRLISGVIWNRIFTDMNLQIDATVQYAIGTEEKGWWPTVYPEDLHVESPFNTYKYEGFPPAPISNPGLASIDAAMNPAKTKCLFYIHDKRRRIHCAETYEGHKKNINRYLK